MKNKLFSFGCCLVMLLTTFFTSCKQEVPVPEMVTISYVSEYGTLDKTEKIVEKGYKLKADDFPKLTEEGYTFDKWYINKVEAKVDTVIDKDSVLVAKWIKVLDKTEPAEATFGEITANDGKALVKWTNPKDTDFKGIELSVTPAEGTLVNPVTLDKTVTSFSVSGLSNGTKYTFKIRTFDNSLNYSDGVTKEVTPSDTSDKIAPSDATLSVTSNNDGVVVLNWTKPSDIDLKGYKLSEKNNSGTLTNAVTLDKNVTSFTVSGLTNGTEYTFTLQSFDNSLNYSVGATATAKPVDTSDKTAPAEVTEYIATNLDGTVVLRWKDPSATDLFGIEITYTPKTTILTRSINKMVEGSIFIAPKSQYVEIPKLTNDTEYTFTLKTMDLSGNKSKGITLKSTPHKYKVGDILLSDGSYVFYNDYQNTPKLTPVAVVCGFKTNGRPLGLGLKQSDTGLAWAKAEADTIGYKTKITKIICTPSLVGEFAADKQELTFTGDTDGSDNWDAIREADPTGTQDAATNYPAFDWVNNYGTAYNLPEGYQDGWYMPSIAELTEIYRNKTEIIAALNILGSGIASPLEVEANHNYWSSSQSDGKDVKFDHYAYNLTFNHGWIQPLDKHFDYDHNYGAYHYKVRSVRAF